MVRLLYLSLAVLLLMGLVACDDDDTNNANSCGNGALDQGEPCDGELFAGQSCASMGFDGGTLGCTQACALDVTSCDGYSPLCGNSEIDGSEECDTNNMGGVACTSMGYEGGVIGCTIACRFDTTQCFGDCPTECLIGAKRCTGTTLEQCLPITDSTCYGWSPLEDCADTGDLCIESARDDASCGEGCTVPCSQEGESRCTGDATAVERCTLNAAKGCTEWVVEPCEGESLCVISGEDAICETPCEESCDPLAMPTLRCSSDGGGIEACLEVEPGCHQWAIQSPCDSNRICNPETTGCQLQGSGATCADAILVPSFPFTLDGTSFLADFADDATGLGDGAGCSAGGDGADLFASAWMLPGESLLVTSDTGLPLEVQAMSSCAEGAACVASGTPPLLFTASATGFVQIAVETWGASYDGSYDITFSKPPPLLPGERCYPNWQTGVCTEGHFCGFNSDSSTGYSCQKTDQGDTCGDPKPATEGHNHGQLQGLTRQGVSSCGVEEGVEQVWRFVPTLSGTLLVTLADFPHAASLTVRDSCVMDSTPLACSAAGATEDASLVLTVAAAVPLYIFAQKQYPLYSAVDPYGYDLVIIPLTDNEAGLCGDGFDNDLDGDIDCMDLDCFGDATFCNVEMSCDDGKDNDIDGDIDCADSDCLLDEACLAKRGYYQIFMGGTDVPDLEGWRLRFTPSGPIDYNYVVTQDATFFVAPGSSGTQVQVLDDYLYSFQLPFSFPFYGFSYDRLYVSSNGWLSFVDPGSALPFESSLLLFSTPIIAVCWDDLTKINFGDMFQIDSGVTGQGEGWWAFTFYNREYNAPQNMLHAQVVLFESGEIRIDWVSLLVQDGLIGIGAPGVGSEPAPVDFITP